jgi:hypothetical protein
MRNHHYPRNLRRIFGIQTVVSVGSPTCPEEGIVDQLIPTQSSGWTFHGQGDVHCRPADLPTLAGLSEITLLGIGGIEVAFLDGIPGIGKNTPVQNLVESGRKRRNV